MVQVVLLNEQRQRVGSGLSVPCTQLRLLDLVSKAKVIVVSGPHAGVAGNISVSTHPCLYIYIYMPVYIYIYAEEDM
jgi:hypothetical protein